ncbi:MAG: hypothetical protein QG635_1514 [Bacteroidota bacterium]|nr:hypothetical protein [Bacteroidota bacterium]
MQKLLNTVLSSLEAVQREFDEYQKANFSVRPPEFFSLELCGEAGELANDEKKIWKGREMEFEKLCDEAADVFIALMNYSNSRRIPIAESVARKLEKIERIRLERAEQGKDY